VLVVTGFTVVAVPMADQSGSFYFNERFTLTEIGGKSGATIQNVASSVDDDNTENTGSICWVKPIRVAPVATLNTFDAGWDSMGYCAPFATGRSAASGVKIVVTFNDDEGRTSSVQATTTVSP
jgi:hypothetical protein